MNTYCRILFVCFGLLALVSCVDLNDPGYSSPYDDPYYNDNYYDRERDRARHERRELERERQRAEWERQRLEQARRDAHNDSHRYDPPPAPRQSAPERCPAGFSPSENKCSPQERKRGCKDIRLPGGLGCVRR